MNGCGKKQAMSFADMTNLSKDLRQKLGESFSLPALTVDATQYSADGTIKSRFRTHDGHFVEGVRIQRLHGLPPVFRARLVVLSVVSFVPPVILKETQS